MEESNTETLDDCTEDFPPVEEVDASTIVVIHPGSRFLRIGLASDPVPKKMLHAIARRRKSNDPKYQRVDPFIIPKFKLDGEKRHKLEDGCNKVAQMLQNSLRSDGRKRFSDKRVSGLNAAIKKPERIPIDDVSDESLPKQDWLETKAETIVGDDILYLHSSSDYNVHFPIHRGEINVTSGVGGSQTGILADLETIWSHAIETLLKVPLSELSKYRAVLIIPALYRRSLIKHYLTILLTNLGFGRAFVLQDHVAATFGAGLGYACVVDMGDQKTSISCVEDGISHSETRIHLDYGGADITQIFHYILRRAGFPYQNCNPLSNRFDALLLYQLKEENCHLNIDICGLAEKTFHVALPGQDVIDRYTFFISDECLIAPNALFYPDLFELTCNKNRKRVRFHTKNQGDPEDPHDNIYLTETSRKYTKAGETTAGEMMAGDNEPSQNDDDLDIVNEDTNQGGNTQGGFNSNYSSSLEDVLLLPLDVAIRKSVEACGSEELKKKMFGCILLVGGGIRFKGVTRYLHQRLALQIPPMYRTEPLEIILDPKDLSSEITSWKGAAILSCLESARELWIKPEEWQKTGQKLLREKAPFPWT